MHVKFVSDLDYSFNKATGKYDIPAVEWETNYGTNWERFESEDARDLALRQNEAYNKLPEVQAFIKSEDEAEDKYMAKLYTAELFDFALENNSKVELMVAIDFANVYRSSMIMQVAKLVCQHNKQVILTQFVPAPATNRIGDFL